MRRNFSCSFVFFAVLVTAFLTSCVAEEREPPPQLSQLQVRQIQTREFSGETVIAGMKAVSAALQDEGYTIDTVNTVLGLITGNRTVSDIDKTSRDTQIFWRGFAKDFRAARSWKVTAIIAEVNKKLRVRISVIEQELNEAGGIIYSHPVGDPALYQALFSKIDKSVFLQKNRL